MGVSEEWKKVDEWGNNPPLVYRLRNPLFYDPPIQERHQRDAADIIERQSAENSRLKSLIAEVIEDDSEGPHFCGTALWARLNACVSTVPTPDDTLPRHITTGDVRADLECEHVTTHKDPCFEWLEICDDCGHIWNKFAPGPDPADTVPEHTQNQGDSTQKCTHPSRVTKGDEGYCEECNEPV